MMEDEARTVSNLRKRRGVAKSSVTRLIARTAKLESEAAAPDAGKIAKQLLAKLQSATEEYQRIHLSLIDAIDDEGELKAEQAVLDELLDTTEELAARIQTVIDSADKPSPDHEYKALSQRLARLQRSLAPVDEALTALEGDAHPDKPRMKLHDEQFQEYKRELTDIDVKLFSLEIEETDDLMTQHMRLGKALFDYSVRLKKLFEMHTLASAATYTDGDAGGVKLPKLEVPTFNGNILHWRSFWEQFSISVHGRSNLSAAEKLVYLQQALKGGPARSTIEGLSRSGDNYDEAVRYLKAKYDRPRQIHQAHVKNILDAPPIKEGTGKEIRKLHDTVLQHLRALKSMGYDPSGPFITSALELKLDQNTMFEWQRHSQKSTGVPHYQELLDFLNLRAQASESSITEGIPKKPKHDIPTRRGFAPRGSVASHTANTEPYSSQCILCKPDKHPLYACPKFKDMSHECKIATLKSNNLCMNCFSSNHFVKQCKSVHRCKRCQKPHHTLLHVDSVPINSSPVAELPSTIPISSSPAAILQNVPASSSPATPPLDINPVAPPFVPKGMELLSVPQSDLPSDVITSAAVRLKSNTLLMTCRVLVCAPDGTRVEARALLDNGSSASFVSERLAQTLRLPRTSQRARISGVAGIQYHSSHQFAANFSISPVKSPHKKFDVTAIIVPRVTCDLPFAPIPLKKEWNHLEDIDLADPGFGCPGKLDLLLGIDIFVEAILHGRRIGPTGTPMAFETHFGWVLAGSTESCSPVSEVTACHISCATGDDLLKKFWETEESPLSEPALNPEERSAIQHFKANQTRAENGRFIVPLPRKENVKPLGESRAQAVRRFLSLERNLHARNQFKEFGAVMEEYFRLGHAEAVPHQDFEKPPCQVFYLPMHAVRKDSSTTTKIRAVFDASMKTSTGISLNDMLMVGPTVHSSLVEVLIRFRMHRIALVADISKMYRSVELPPSDRDLHRFVWRNNPDDTLQDFRMTRVTFGVSSSAFVANMAVKQNAADFAHEYPLAAKIVNEAFYVDDCLTGADSIEEGIELYRQLQALFAKADFLLRKWNSSSPSVLEGVPHELRDDKTSLTISDQDETYTKTLGIEWHSVLDHFRLNVANRSPPDQLTKRALVSDIARTYDVLGWFAPVIIKAKILLQKVWESGVDWDEDVPESVAEEWSLWSSQLKSLSQVHIPRCYFPKEVEIVSIQLHGFSDASESAYAAVVYLRLTDTRGGVHISLVASKTKVAPIKRLTIPRLELCGTCILSKLLEYVRQALSIPIENIHAWTDSTVVLNWLDGSPRRFKVYVGNRISFILDRIPSNRWKHVPGEQNPADCASRGLLPCELVNHDLWWNGPEWLASSPSNWPRQPQLTHDESETENMNTCHLASVEANSPLCPLDRFSSYLKLVRVTAWAMRFIHNCRIPRVNAEASRNLSSLTVQEITRAENYWLSCSQAACFSKEIENLKLKKPVQSCSPLMRLHPFLDSSGLLRVSGREQKSNLAYSAMHPVILSGKHILTKLIIQLEHTRLLHAGITLLSSSLNGKYHIIGGRKAIRDVTRRCVICLRQSKKPEPQQMGQLPIERVTPDIVFENVGVDYAGPIYTKHGYVRKPTIVKSYVCIFVSLSVKAVHIELVSDLTSDCFISALRRFIARRGKPKLLWSDHGSNFVGAKSDLKGLVKFLNTQMAQKDISDFCTTQRIEWKFIPEKAPHFGGLWESAVKSMKYHLKRVMSDVKLTFEECSTVLTQIEACMNSRPLVALPCDGEGIDVLTPGHFLIGRSIESLPDPSFSYRPLSLLRRWDLCQNLVRQFWERWRQEYLTSLRAHNKWHKPSRNIQINDIVVLRDANLVPTKWPLGRVVKAFHGEDHLVRVVDVKTQSGIYRRPVTKVALILPNETEQTKI